MIVTEHPELPAVVGLLTEKLRALFDAEIANESEGGDSPATISTAIDSLWQGQGIMDDPTAEGNPDVPYYDPNEEMDGTCA